MTDPTLFPSGSAFTDLTGRAQAKLFAVDDSVNPPLPGFVLAGQTGGDGGNGTSVLDIPEDDTPNSSDLTLVFDPNTGEASATPVGAVRGEAVITVPTSGNNQTLTWPTFGGTAYYDITLNADCSLSMAGSAAGVHQRVIVLLRQDSTGNHAVTWPSGTIWANGLAAPNGLSGQSIIRVEIETFDGGSTVLGRY